eukprot:CAMPEP_0202980362 /NCGR_PEP_ID=MMETSP1396-20130829/86306_1 /ASSEMBLY_ACC=CAM_ASM_000872 /TAXON_ID= /ORGANISM="Pseudokeronopsis sp., Strain Brazil" /LENGTH=67 /DNA_ID=CAMNT_0049720297 /DNA_START=1323 /DNA_END=1526 /DNA_ORIENTATION=+
MRNEDDTQPIVFMDLAMPIMDGYLCAKLIREVEKEKGLNPAVIVGLSAYSYKEVTKEFEKSGMDHYL